MTNSFLSNLAIFTIGVYVGQEYNNVINIKQTSIKILQLIKQTDLYKEIIKK
jgi:sporulation protein YlmC with PRC-barrel domain